MVPIAALVFLAQLQLPLNVYHVDSTVTLQRQDALRAAWRVAEVWGQNFPHYPMVVNQFQQVRNLYPGINSPLSVAQSYDEYREIILPGSSPSEFNLLIAPPITVGDRMVTLGRSAPGSYGREPGLAAAWCANATQCERVALHELLHNAGAGHREGRRQIMNRFPQRNVIGRRTKAEVRSHLKGLR